MENVIRPYRTEDKISLIEIFKRNIPQYFDPTELKGFEEYIDQFGDTYLTVEENGLIIGGTGYQISNEKTVGSITWIFFLPDKTGKGIGKKAVEHCLTILKSNPNIQTVTVRTSQLVYPFFEKLGFRLINIEKDYWAPGLDLCLMSMDCSD